MKRIISIFGLLFLSSFLFFSFQMDQIKMEREKVFKPSNNSDNRIKIVEGEFGISEVYFFRNRDKSWVLTDIISIDTIQEYLKVQPLGTKEIFELFVDWDNDKMVVVNNQNDKVIYWLE